MAFTPMLYTPRLTLRPFALADAPRVQELAGDPLIAATTSRIPHPYPAALAQEWIGSHSHLAQENRQFHFAVTLAGTRTPGRENDLADTGHLIGTVSLMFLGEPAYRRAELGYWIGVPYWNRGFATEAAHAALSFGFVRKNLRRIVAQCVSSNAASVRVLQKLGMSLEDTIAEGFVKGDQARDLECYGVNMHQWQATRARHRFPALAPA